MSKFETVEIPFQLFGNRQILTDMQIAEKPWLRDFIERFPDCFEYSPAGCYWIFSPEGRA